MSEKLKRWLPVVFAAALWAGSAVDRQAQAQSAWESVDLSFDLITSRVGDSECRSTPEREEACVLALASLANSMQPPRELHVSTDGLALGEPGVTAGSPDAFAARAERERRVISAWRRLPSREQVSFDAILDALPPATRKSKSAIGNALRSYIRRVRDPHTELAPYAAVAQALHHREAEPVLSFMTRDRDRGDVVSFELGFIRGLRFGWIEVKDLNDIACGNVSHALLELHQRGAEGWVVDLRGNGGGVAREADCIVDLFLEADTPLYRLESLGNGSALSRREAEGAVVSANPLVVLVDSGTASGAEVIAAVLQARKRARIVGARTFGKGTYQRASPWSDHSELVLYESIARIVVEPAFEFQLHGVLPDVSLYSAEKVYREENAYLNPIQPIYPPVPNHGFDWSNRCPRELEPGRSEADPGRELATRVLYCEVAGKRR